VGDPSLAASELGWVPQVKTPELARIMVDNDVAALAAGGGTWIDKVVKHG
jgi:GDPmannose 4,6-dehydratase